MSYLAGAVLLLTLVLCILARKEQVPEECDASAVTKPFYRLGVWLEKKARRERWYKYFFAKNEERLRLLQEKLPADDQLEHDHMRRRHPWTRPSIDNIPQDAP